MHEPPHSTRLQEDGNSSWNYFSGPLQDIRSWLLSPARKNGLNPLVGGEDSGSSASIFTAASEFSQYGSDFSRVASLASLYSEAPTDRYWTGDEYLTDDESDLSAFRNEVVS